MQSPPFPGYLVPPRSKYSPQHHVFKHPQLPFLPQCQRPSFTPIQNNRQNYSSIYLDLPFKIKVYTSQISISFLQPRKNFHLEGFRRNSDILTWVLQILKGLMITGIRKVPVGVSKAVGVFVNTIVRSSSLCGFYPSLRR